jgi:membrane protein implicated in regulation of membrane protease activity
MIIFIAIAIGAFILVAGSFIFGHDHDMGHDHGDLGHDLGVDSEPTISFFSTKTLATLLMGFGASGAIAMHYGMSSIGASLVGLFCGVILAVLMAFVLNLFYGQQASSLVATSSAVGCTGTVTVSIPENGLGEVSLNVEGQYTTYSASARDGGSLAKGQLVRVVRSLGSQLVVEKE